MPRISVIVPVYKAERYLERCVASILAQTYSDFELLLIDDGSQDNSPKMCDMWAERDERICVLHKDNGGASSARNAGLAIAQGDWIAFVDSDDFLEKRALEILYTLAEKHKVPMAIGEMRRVTNKSANQASTKVPLQTQILSHDELLQRFFRMNGEPDNHRVWGTLVQREIMREYRFIEGRMNEDIETCYYWARKCSAAVYTSEIVYNYYLNTGGVTHSEFTAKKLDLLAIWEIVMQRTRQYTPQYLDVCRMNEKRARFTLLTQMLLNGYDHNDPLMVKTRKELKSDVRRSFGDLLRWKMPLSRKIALIVVCIL